MSDIGTYWFESENMTKSTNRKKNLGLIGSERTANYVWFFEHLLMIDTFLSDTKGHKHSFILELQRYIPMMMERAARVMDRKEGTGMNFIKFHLILHLCQDIINMGLPVNVDSEAGESNHKENTKSLANHTQK